ncbi:MAG: helix-turn-helix domain-containing protein [Stenotrophomonas sp.]|nr:helix-turn-helix domain-containing protein [Stenotrophomonas sp.]
MPRLTPPTHPRHVRQLSTLGERLRAARLRRKLTQAMVAERVGVTLPTIRKLESGDPTSSLATVIRVLQVLGLAQDVDKLAAEDTLGRQLQDRELKRPRRRTATTCPPNSGDKPG